MAPSLRSRPSKLSLSDPIANGTGGHSLAAELVSAVGPVEGGARSLAEEFGIDLGGEDELEEADQGGRSGEAAPHSPSLSYGHDPQFGNPDDFEPDPFSTSHEFDRDADHLDPFGNQMHDFEDAGHHQGFSLGAELSLEDEFSTEPNGLPRDDFQRADEEQDLQTPTRPKMRTRTASSSYRSQESRSLGLGMAPSQHTAPSPNPSSSRSSFSSNTHSTSTSSAADQDDDSDSSDSPPPQRLFSSSNVSSSASSSHQPQTLSLEEVIALPSTFLPLLAKDDRSFDLEQRVIGLVTRMEEVGRVRDEWSRELGVMEREVGRLVAEGVRFDEPQRESDDNAGLGVGMRGPMGSLVEDNDDGILDGEEDLNRSIDSEDDDHFGTARLQLNVQSPYTPSRTKARPPNPFSPSPHPPRSPSAAFQASPSEPPAGPSPDLPLQLSTLSSHTSSLVDTLSSLQDATQITLSSAADAGRRLRALRAQFAVMKGEEEGVERARKALAGEEDETDEGGTVVETGRGRGETVKREMDGFKRAVDEFEERTKLIRQEHQRFLVGAV